MKARKKEKGRGLQFIYSENIKIIGSLNTINAIYKDDNGMITLRTSNGKAEK